jgi:hypothetical protein
MKRVALIGGSVFVLLLVGAVVAVGSSGGSAPAVTGVEQVREGSAVSYVIAKKGPVQVQDFVLANPDRLVVDFLGARFALDRMTYDGDGRFVERVRTSQFTDAPEEITRVVFDLKDRAAYRIEDHGDRLVVRFLPEMALAAPRTLPVRQAGMTGGMAVPTVPAPEAASSASPTRTSLTETPAVDPLGVETVAAPPMEREESAAAWWVDNSWAEAGAASNATTLAPPVPRSRTMTIDVQNADIQTVLRSIAEFAGVNIVSGPEVTGEVTAHLTNVPWKEALSIILKAHGYGFKEEHGIIRVSTIEKLTKEELEIQAAERRKDDLLPLVSRIIPLNYANAAEIKKALDKIVSSRGSIEVEKGNNALVVTDIEKNVDKVEQMAKALDRRGRQVEIGAKRVDVDVEATRELGIQWDFLNLSPNNVSVAGDAVVDASPGGHLPDRNGAVLGRAEECHPDVGAHQPRQHHLQPEDRHGRQPRGQHPGG